MDPCGNSVSIAQEIEVFDPGLELGRQLTGTSVTSKDTNCFFNKPVGHQLEKKEEKKNKKKNTIHNTVSMDTDCIKGAA